MAVLTQMHKPENYKNVVILKLVETELYVYIHKYSKEIFHYGHVCTGDMVAINEKESALRCYMRKFAVTLARHKRH